MKNARSCKMKSGGVISVTFLSARKRRARLEQNKLTRMNVIVPFLGKKDKWNYRLYCHLGIILATGNKCKRKRGSQETKDARNGRPHSSIAGISHASATKNVWKFRGIIHARTGNEVIYLFSRLRRERSSKEKKRR